MGYEHQTNCIREIDRKNLFLLTPYDKKTKTVLMRKLTHRVMCTYSNSELISNGYQKLQKEVLVNVFIEQSYMW